MPKIIGSSLAEHRAATRQRLFDALSELMSERTFESLTMAEIAKAANVGRTAVYNHFEDKEALLLAYIAHETAKHSADLQKALRATRDPLARLRIYIRKQLELGTSYQLAPGTDLRRMVSTDTGHELHAHAAITEEILRNLLVDAMKQRVIERQNIPTLITLINATLAGRQLPRNPREREFFIHCIQCFILRALGVTGNAARMPDAMRFLGHSVDILDNPFTSEPGGFTATIACPVQPRVQPRSH